MFLEPHRERARKRILSICFQDRILGKRRNRLKVGDQVEIRRLLSLWSKKARKRRGKEKGRKAKRSIHDIIQQSHQGTPQRGKSLD